MHPTLGSWFGNPSFRYLWSQNLCQGKAEQLNPVTHSDRYLLLSCTNRWEKLTALYGSVTQRKVLSSASQVNKEQYHSDHFIFTAKSCTLFVTLEEEGEGSLSFPGNQGKLKFHFSTSGDSNFKIGKKRGKKKKRHHCCKIQQNHTWNPSETEMMAHSPQGTEETAWCGWTDALHIMGFTEQQS